MNRQNTKRILKISIYSIIALCVIGYAFFGSRSFIEGPSITVTEPQDGSTFSTSTIEIKGVVKRSQSITLDGRSILIDNQGNFDEPALLAPGYNVVSLVATDQFNRSKEYRLQLIYKVN